VLKDENEDQHQRQQPNDDRRPGSTEASVLLARIGLPVRQRSGRRRIIRAQLLLLSALHPRTPVTPSRRSLIVRPCRSITYSKTPLSWSLVRILMMLSARRSSEPISRYRSMITLWNRNDSPPIGSVIGPRVVVSLVITTEAPAARIRPTRLREYAGKRSASRAANTNSARLSITTRRAEPLVSSRRTAAAMASRSSS